MLRHSSSSPRSADNYSVKTHEILYRLTALEWNQLQNAETLADLQEELEDVADVQLVEPDKLKISATSDSWVARHTIHEEERKQQRKEQRSKSNIGGSVDSVDSQNGVTYIDWDELIQRVKQFFESAHGDVIMQGWLMKKMEFRNWKKRWVVIRKDARIDYYSTTKTGKRKGIIDLSNMLGVREVFHKHIDAANADKEFVFEIENADRKVRFACTNRQDMKLWVRTIQENCVYIKRERAHSWESDDDELVFTEKKVKRYMIDPIIV